MELQFINKEKNTTEDMQHTLCSFVSTPNTVPAGKGHDILTVYIMLCLNRPHKVLLHDCMIHWSR